MQRSLDNYWMLRSLQCAYRGLGLTSPNPPVGALIIRHCDPLNSFAIPSNEQEIQNCILGEGYHQRAGAAHAERNAIADAIQRGYEETLQGSTIYITLEPCSSWGRTAPCTEGIIAAGIARVVYACDDPDERHRGKALLILQEAGIQVERGICQEAAMRLLRPWSYAQAHGRPWVVAKVATSLDARLSRQSERWLSSTSSLQYAHRLREESDAILVGGQTIRDDNPSLTIRDTGREVSPLKQQPWRVVLSRDIAKIKQEMHLQKSPLLYDEYKNRTLFFAEVKDLKKELLEELYQKHGVVQIMLECGGSLLKQFLEAELINEWVQIICPFISGGKHQLIPDTNYLCPEAKLQESTWTRSGSDAIIRGIIN